jgi:hypothetical protein
MKHIVRNVILAVLASCVLAAPAISFAGATIIIQNNDGSGEGFNDPTPWFPRGGNPATTLGQARLNAFQYAANQWASCINSNVTIVIDAQMNPLFCDATSAVLGSAGAATVHRDFTNRPLPSTWYPQALANALAGYDLSPSNPDISATFNSNLDGSGGCMGGAEWYYGYNESPPPGDIDFVTIVMHEIGHGLGFQTFVDLASGAKLMGYNDAYMMHLNRANANPGDYRYMNNAGRVAASKSDPNLRWKGINVTNQHPNIPLTAGLNGGYARMYGPNPQEPGSSVSHWSKALTPNEVMEPSYTGPNHDPGLALHLMADIAWPMVSSCVCAADPTALADADTITVSRTETEWHLRIELDNLGPGDAKNVNATMTENDPGITITDPNCNYGNMNSGVSDWGTPDSYVIDTGSWPGGTFDVDVDIDWEDACGNNYSDTFTLTLEPPAAVPVAFQQIFATPTDNGIAVNWTIHADEAFEGFNIYRKSEKDDYEIRLNQNGLIDESQRSYIDKNVQAGTAYLYSVSFVMPDGSEMRSPPVEAAMGEFVTRLDQNRPNPFNPSTEIQYRIGNEAHVNLKIFDVTGRLIRTLVDQPQEAGIYRVMWGGREGGGRLVSTGVYFYRLTAGKFSQTRRMVLLK